MTKGRDGTTDKLGRWRGDHGGEQEAPRDWRETREGSRGWEGTRGVTREDPRTREETREGGYRPGR